MKITPEVYAALSTLSRLQVKVGDGFHPDTLMQDYCSLQTGEPTFTQDEATNLQEQLNGALEVLEAADIDPYDAFTKPPYVSGK